MFVSRSYILHVGVCSHESLIGIRRQMIIPLEGIGHKKTCPGPVGPHFGFHLSSGYE